jgi:sarcosine oxidase subunit beta
LPDSEPVIGASSTTDGLFYAFGFSGSGFQIGPGVGETLAELIDTGTTSMALDAFSIRRFGNGMALQSASASASVEASS